MEQERPHKYVASVLIADRPGIMRDITSAITDRGGNIDGVRQTVVEGYFSVILTASFGDALDPDSLRDAMLANFVPGEASVVVRPFCAVAPAAAIAEGRRYVLVVSGKDRPGILKRTTTFLAAGNINIEDWEYRFDADQVTYIGVVTIPRSADIAAVQRGLRDCLEVMQLRGTLQHENIFRATNEIGPIRSLLQGGGDA